MRMFRLDVPGIVDVGNPFSCVLQFTEEHLYPLDGKSYPFELSLRCEGTPNNADLNKMMEVHSGNLQVQSPASTTARITILNISSEYFGRNFVLVAKVKALRDIVVESNPFLVVNYRLKIIENPPFDHVLFNDQPGDKYLHIPVQLMDCNGYRVSNRNVPLAVTLYYEDGTPVLPTVQKPELYHLQNDNIGISMKGTDMISIRILQISRNHGGRHFYVRVSPRDVEDADIAFAECGPFEVRTKKVDGSKTSSRESLKCKRPRSPGYHAPITKRARSPEFFVPPSVDDNDGSSKTVLQKLDAHIEKVRLMKWVEGKTTEEALDAKGNVVRVERISMTPRNPNEFIVEFLRTYDEILRPQLLKAVNPPPPAQLTFQNLAALGSNKLPQKQISGLTNFSFGSGADYFDMENAATSLTFLSQVPEKNDSHQPDKQISGLTLLADMIK